jgi:hypothetical protein
MSAAPDQAAVNAETAHRIGDLVHNSFDYARAWSELFASEAEFARICAYRLIVGALVFGALVLGLVIIANALAVSALDRWLHDWVTAFALTLMLNFVFLLVLLAAMRSWWRSMSLPRSRRALRDLLSRIDHETERARASH